MREPIFYREIGYISEASRTFTFSLVSSPARTGSMLSINSPPNFHCVVKQ